MSQTRLTLSVPCWTGNVCNMRNYVPAWCKLVGRFTLARHVFFLWALRARFTPLGGTLPSCSACLHKRLQLSCAPSTCTRLTVLHPSIAHACVWSARRMPTTITVNTLVCAPPACCEIHTLHGLSWRGACLPAFSLLASFHSLHPSFHSLRASLHAALHGDQPTRAHCSCLAPGPFGCTLMAGFYGRFSQPYSQYQPTVLGGAHAGHLLLPTPSLPGARLSPLFEPQVTDLSLSSH